MYFTTYAEMRDKLKSKTRGRKMSIQVSKAPNLWATYHPSTDLITVTLQVRSTGRRLQVAQLDNQNNLTIDIHGWHTQLSTKITHVLTPYGGRLYKGRVWVGDYPVDGPIKFCNRHLVVQERFLEASTRMNKQLEDVTLDDLDPAYHLRYACGSWLPKKALTKAVVAYARGLIGKESLSQRDILTISGLHLDGKRALRDRVYMAMVEGG